MITAIKKQSENEGVRTRASQWPPVAPNVPACEELGLKDWVEVAKVKPYGGSLLPSTVIDLIASLL
jgi:hypothetical protein